MTRIAGRYEITATLGHGGMGVVYRAYDPAPMDREVAVKTLHEVTDSLALDLFYKECSALKSISHPNIVEIFDMGEYDDNGHRRPFFVMPLLPGQTLDELVRKASHRLTVERVVEIVAQTCRGLQAAHDHGLIHRDLKPSNIFVMADDSVKIIDFGVAHAVHAQSQTAGFDKGTLLYMAPEQLQHKPVSAQSDIYALGVTAYEALTRRQPFRGSTEQAVIQTILSHVPPPASDLNPSVSQLLSRVIHKAMAKQPWNRYDTAREFGETLQKASRNESIALFDPARIQPRVQTASRALEKGDFQFAGEIVAELEAEGNIDPQISLLRTQIDQVARQKTIGQLLESARARFEEQEDPLALQKLQEVLQLDPGNVAAIGLRSKIEERRSDRQIEKWMQLARQHVENHSYGHAREALQNALVMRPRDTRAARLLKELEGEEREYIRLRKEKSEIYEAAVNAWKNGEVSQALSQMKRVLELDRQAPDSSSPDGAGVYQSFFNKLRSEHDALNNGYAQARRHLAAREFTEALRICEELLERYPGQALVQALKFDLEEQRRQQLSSFIAEIDRRLDAEQDLDAKVHLLRDAVAQYPQEEHFARLLKLSEDKRDLVHSIVERGRIHEERGEIAEAVSDFETLQAIYSAYPGLRFEKERLQRRLEQHTRDTARGRWVLQVDQQLEAGSYQRAIDLVAKALVEFPDDGEILELRKVAEQALERSARAEDLAREGQDLCAQGEFDRGVDLLKHALQLDDRPTVRLTLADVFAARAQAVLGRDWQSAETYAARALDIDPVHALARSLRAQALDRRRLEAIDQCASQARRLQAAGDLDAAVAHVQAGLSSYPGDPRLTSIHDAIAKDLARTRSRTADLDQLTALRHDVEPVSDDQPPPAPVEPTRLVARRHHDEPKLETLARGVEGKIEVRRPASSSRWAWWGVAAAAVVVLAAAGVVMFQPNESAAPSAVTSPALVAPATVAPDPSIPVGPQSDSTATSAEAGATAPATSSLASLALTLPAGTRIAIDNVPVGVAGADGRFSYATVTPGTRSLQIAVPNYEPVVTSRDFVAGQTLSLAAADLGLKRASVGMEFVADADTAVRVLQNGAVVQQFTGRTKLSLLEGDYEVRAAGPVGIELAQPLSISSRGSKVIDLRGVASGLERFGANTFGSRDGWQTRKGGGFLVYDRTAQDASIVFTVRLDRGGWLGLRQGRRLRWVVGAPDPVNHVRLELDSERLYRIDVVGGKATEQENRHNIPDVDQVHLNVQMQGSTLVVQYSVPARPGWNVIHRWSRSAPFDGRFAFYLPNDDELQLTGFAYYPTLSASSASRGATP